ncbi:hypothetical protein D0Z07_0986 [Hyphodiscus hymeniophilus]|uniref:Uncharacterized protein n=1 Tax=Hyphodiscus hymeniophilus TaxID=353542 RepID=A0A9P6VQT6_9HELO|nr:hypothetical protein D0Z07_0986 [Hyphodiscus hymeniophilus]
MFSMLPMPARTYEHTHYYSPAVSSPLSSSPFRRSLSPRDPNVSTSPRAFFTKPTMPPTPTPSKKSRASPNASSTSSTSSRETVFSQRLTKANPLIHARSSSTGTDGRETRRKLFLKKVREDSEEKRWKARGGDDEMMRSIWISEQRRREEKQRREAIGLDAPLEEEYSLSLDEIMADEVALREEAELEALAAMSMEQPPQGFQSIHQHLPSEDEMDLLLLSTHENISAHARNQPLPETPYGSDDEEYDHIFMDVIQEENRLATESSHQPDGEDVMDLS